MMEELKIISGNEYLINEILRSTDEVFIELIQNLKI
jgi:hypothetical protein